MSSQGLTGKLSDLKIIRFLLTGVINTVFGYSVFAALLFFKAQYLVALLLATVAGVIFNYFSFGRMVFNNHGWSVFTKFVVAYSLIYGVNAVLLGSLTEILHVNPYVGQIVCIPISVVLGWILMNFWVYKKND
jgi:putative flippase GtrA